MGPGGDYFYLAALGGVSADGLQEKCVIKVLENPMIRTWGPWSYYKLQILGNYLRAFATASKSSIHRVYLDAFAGEGVGINRLTGEEFRGSARIALDVTPPFTHLRYFELDRQRATRLADELQTAYPDRDIRVYADDCNVAIRQALADLRPVRRGAAFAFLDPDGQQLHFDTVPRHRRTQNWSPPEGRTVDAVHEQRIDAQPGAPRGGSGRRTGR